MVYFFWTTEEFAGKPLPKELVGQKLSPPPGHWIMYMGEHKEENELLIKYGLPTDLWFHVDDLSSAHVYLRMPKGYEVDTIPAEIIQDCAQLCKANSITGSKRARVRIVYTMWSNLRKKKSMAVGQIGYHNISKLKFISVDKENHIVNRLNKTKVEKESSIIKKMRDQYEKQQRKLEKRRKIKEAEEERLAIEKQKREEELRSYKDVMKSECMTSNQDVMETFEEYEDDFM